MKKKTKKVLFDPRCPGAKMIFYGAILLVAAGAINAFFSWVLAITPYLSDATAGDVFSDTIVFSLQVAVAFIVAVDSINNRNRPSKARGVMIKALCALLIAVVFMLRFSNFENEFWGVVASGITIAGSLFIFIGAFRNAKVLGGKK